MPDNCSSDCYDGVWYSLLKYYEFDYEIYNIKYLYPKYYIVNNDKIFFKRQENVCGDILKDIYDIDVSFIDRSEATDLINIAEKTIKNKPIGVFVDPYYCSWSTFYRKAHYNHIILIVDIDYINYKYICFDIYYNSVGYVKMDIDILQKYYSKYFVFEYKKINIINFDLLINKTNKIIDCFHQNQDYDIDRITYILSNCIADFSVSTLRTNTTLVNLQKISEDRINFSIFLRRLGRLKKSFSFSDVYDLLNLSNQELLILKSLLTKFIIKKKMKEDEMRMVLKRIYEVDKLLIETLGTRINELR